MASLSVTKDTTQSVVPNVNRDMDVAVDVTGVSFSVYVRVTRAGVVVKEWKVRFGASFTLPLLRNDVVQAVACGTGTIQVTIL